MAVAVLINGWDVNLWADGFRSVAGNRDTRLYPDEIGERADIEYALCWRPTPGALKTFPNLKAIFSLGAGVDAILKDTELPDVPIARIVDPDMTMRMSEYVVQHVLMHHRQQRRLDEMQRNADWSWFSQWPASAVRVGVLGLGALGSDAARKLRMMGFQVAGWSQSKKSIPDVECFAGAQELDPFLKRTDILVCLLPATPGTRGIINRSLIRKLAKDGPLGGPVIVNPGRGEHQVEADILAALDQGELLAVTLDVAQTEPLPKESPLWRHPKVTITPHLAADSDTSTICRNIVRQMERFEKGQPLENLVDRRKGY
ncbi:MAG: 2-hydroxyacid dehydrogenase [Parvibaculaceae bacterium]